MHIFLKKRSDLPETNKPFVVLCIFASVVFAWMGAKVAVSSPSGPVSALPFLILSSAVYTSVIILWRKFLALLITPLTAVVLLLTKCNMFCLLSICLSVLFISYVAAVYLLSGETRFMRMTALSCGIAVILAPCAFAWLSLQFSSFSAFYETALAYVNLFLQQVSRISGTAFPANTAAGVLRSILLSAPALLGIVSELFAASLLFLCNVFFRVLDCTKYFHPVADDGITTPRSFGAVSLCSLFLMFCTSPYDNPLLYGIISNTFMIIAFPCAYVGIREFYRRIQEKYSLAHYYFRYNEENRRRFVLPILLFFLFMILILGISNALLLSSAIGAIYILRAKKTNSDTAGTLSE